MDIKHLLQRIENGDRQAYAHIVAQFQRPLFGYLGRMALGQGAAEDIAQETFLRAWSNLGGYKPELAAFSTWLFSIARHLALNELDSAAHRHEQAMPDDGVEPMCGAAQPPDQLAQKQQSQRLQAALHRLPLSDRSALALAYVQDMDLAAVARIEGCSTAAIKTRLHRAREKLKSILEEQDG
ncbi:MAG: sigma-70 family RNA polymerase sigma factor [Pseudomonadota bacterium]